MQKLSRISAWISPRYNKMLLDSRHSCLFGHKSILGTPDETDVVKRNDTKERKTIDRKRRFSSIVERIVLILNSGHEPYHPICHLWTAKEIHSNIKRFKIIWLGNFYHWSYFKNDFNALHLPLDCHKDKATC